MFTFVNLYLKIYTNVNGYQGDMCNSVNNPDDKPQGVRVDGEGKGKED